jgi:hypothetical protein
MDKKTKTTIIIVLAVLVGVWLITQILVGLSSAAFVINKIGY